MLSSIDKIISLNIYCIILLAIFILGGICFKDKLIKEYKRFMNDVLGQFESENSSIAHYEPTRAVYKSLIVVYILIGIGYAVVIALLAENYVNIINIAFTIINTSIPLFYISVIDSFMRIILKNSHYKVEKSKLEEDTDRIKVTAFVIMIIILVLYLMVNVFRSISYYQNPIDNDKTVIEHSEKDKKTIDIKHSKIMDKSGNVYKLKKSN